MDKKIPVMQFEIDPTNEKLGLRAISIVTEGAIESDFIVLSKDNKPKLVELKAPYKQVLAGLALIPDKLILQYDASGNPFYGKFSKETIEQAYHKFFKDGLINEINLQHESTDKVDGYMFESFIVDSEHRLADVKAKGIEEVTLGSWYLAYKINDPTVFQKAVDGYYKGFSIEGYFARMVKQTENNNLNKIELMMTGFLTEFKNLLSKFEKAEKKDEKQEEKEITLQVADTADGKQVEYGDVGQPVSIVEGDTKQPATANEIQLKDGRILVIESGNLKEIKEAPVQQSKVAEPELKMNAELESIKSELAKAKEDLKKANEEIVKLQKAPIATPVVKTDLKKSKKLTDEEFKKLSSIEKIAYKNGVNLSESLINKLNKK